MGENQSDSEVIGASLAEPSAFGAIFERHYDAVHGYLQRRLDATRADEIASQTFLVAFDRRSRFDRRRPQARPWLLGIATNLAHNHRRHEIVELRAIAAIRPVAGAGVDGVGTSKAWTATASATSPRCHGNRRCCAGRSKPARAGRSTSAR